MQYAIQTRDYNNDYTWICGRESPSETIITELQKQIEGVNKGIAVIFQNGSFHLIIAGIYKLGNNSIGSDPYNRDIRLNLVLSGLSQEQAKGITQYYFANQDNPGIGFADIVSWSKDSWSINEEKINLAFNSIPTCQATGRTFFCESGGLFNFSDLDFSE